jgi:SPP1 gp7 family putative phage head morphogenesis protein
MANESHGARQAEALAERQRLIDIQNTFANQMLQRYLVLENSLLKDVSKIVERIRILRAQGLEPGVALEAERERITNLLDDVREQMQTWADGEMRRISTLGRQQVTEGLRTAARQIEKIANPNWKGGNLNAPVHSSLTPIQKIELSRLTSEAVRAINEVIALPKNWRPPTIGLVADKKFLGAYNGGFASVNLNIGTLKGEKALAIIHELGHWIDHQMGGGKSLSGREGKPFWSETSSFRHSLANTIQGKKWIRDAYYGLPQEMFARFFEQYVLERSELNIDSKVDQKYFTREEMQKLTNEFEAAAKKAGIKTRPQAPSPPSNTEHERINMFGSFGRVNAAALERIVDRYRTIPVTRRYANAGLEAKEAVKNALFTAVGKGDNPRTVVREIQNALGSTRDHADTIARTWIIDAHRGAGLDYYRSQGTRIGGWEWLCAKNLRTCPVCLAMDGTIHPLDEPFGSHPRCRCTHIPLLDDEFEETPQLTGQQYYDSLSYEDKIKMVGPLKARLIADGKIGLKDLVDEYVDPDYGLSRREKSVKSLLFEGKITQADFSSAWARRNENIDLPRQGQNAILERSSFDKLYDVIYSKSRTTEIYERDPYGDSLEKVFGKPITKEQLIEALGIPSGSIVDLQYRGVSNREILVRADYAHEGTRLTMRRNIYRREDGILTIKHDFFEILNPSATTLPKGSGTAIFARSVEGYKKLGIREIITEAARHDSLGLNGYYTWARLGFDGFIPSGIKVPDSLGGSTATIQEILKKPGGLEWWKINGDTFKGRFNTDDGSDSMQILSKYLEHRRKQ